MIFPSLRAQRRPKSPKRLPGSVDRRSSIHNTIFSNFPHSDPRSNILCLTLAMNLIVAALEGCLEIDINSSMGTTTGVGPLHDIRHEENPLRGTAAPLEADNLGARSLGYPGSCLGGRREAQAGRKAPPPERPADVP